MSLPTGPKGAGPIMVADTAQDKPSNFFIEQAEGHPDLPSGKAFGAAHDSVGFAVIEQENIIPSTGQRIPTSKWEYWTFCIFCFCTLGNGIGTNGGALRQNLINQQFPNGTVHWAGRDMPLNSLLLDFTGILFACQLVILLIIGPFADYGSWRPWILISCMVVVYVCQFAMIGFKGPSQWQAAQGFWLIGNIAVNLATAFYQATFPGLVRDLPRMIESERQVLSGEKSPEEHAELDMYERAQMYNWINVCGSAGVVIFSAIAVGISAGIGFDTVQKLNYSYRVLLGYFGAISILLSVPFFIVNKHRPGQQLPVGTKWYTAGPKQVYQAGKGIKDLKQALLYLVAFFMLQETFGTYFNITGILQNEVIHYSPLLLNALGLVADLCGGSGTFFMLLLQKKFRFSIKAGVLYGGSMTLIPSLFGLIGCYTTKLGFHQIWAFWLAQVWNFQTAAWGSYNVAMISEVVPAPKSFMFFALFNTVGKTSGFIGPLIASAIVDRAGGNTSYAYWFLFAMGSLGVVILYFVNPNKAKLDNARYLEKEATDLYDEEQRSATRRPTAAAAA